MKKLIILSILCAITLAAFSQNIFNKKQQKNKSEMENGMYAKINTTKGDIIIQLEYKKTPLTVANFVALAEGDMINDHKSEGEAYYDGLKFHRVISDFMICERMLQHFIRKVHSGKFFRPSPRVLVCVPCGATQVERRAIRESASGAGARIAESGWSR